MPPTFAPNHPTKISALTSQQRSLDEFTARHYLAGTDPNDFYNGQAPQLAIVSGDNQAAPAGLFNAQPVVVSVRNHAGTMVLANAPVTFAVTFGGGLLATTNSGSATMAASLNLRTDTNGLVQVCYQQPATTGVASTITVTAGAGQSAFHTTSSGVAGDTDGNGLPDAWEMANFGHTGVDPNADPDGDGVTNLQEYQQGTDPNDYFNGVTPQIVGLVGANGELGPGGALSVRIAAPDGTPLPNAPAKFTAKAGGHLLSPTPGGSGESALEVRADGSGVATVYVVEGN